MRIRDKRRELIVTVLIAMFLAGLLTLTVMAEGFSEEDAAGIYSGSELYSPGAAAEFNSWLNKQVAHVADDIVGASLGHLLILLGDSIYSMFASGGLTLSAVIYGRVGGAMKAMNDNNVFSFEMVSGNFYGITAMSVYSQVRSVFFLVMMCIVMWQMVSFVYTGGGQRARLRLIETVKRIIIVSLFLVALPWIIDLLLYLRDSILYAEMVTAEETISMFADSLGVKGFSLAELTKMGGGADVAKLFRKAASKDPSFMLALAYFASVLGFGYFFGAYVGYAITMMVLVIFFPFACAIEMVKPGMLGDWIKQLIGILIIPVIDAAILILPLMCGIANKSGDYVHLSFVEMVMIWSIVPARGQVRQWLGFGSSGALEMSGVGAIMGVARLATTIGRTIVDPKTGVASMIGSARSDEKMASMYMDKAKRADEMSESSAQEAVREMGAGVSSDPVGEKVVSSAEEKLKDVSGKTSAERAAKREEIIGKASKDLSHERTLLQEDVEKRTERVSTLKARASEKKAESQTLLSRIATGRSENPEKDEADAAKAKTMAAHLEAMAASEQKEIAEKKRQIGAIDRTLRTSGAGRSGRAGGYPGGAGVPAGSAGSTDFPEIDDYADINNFEAPEMRGISYERRAELLRQRADRYRRGAVAKAAGSVTGGVIGLGVGMYGGQNMSMMTTAVGIEAGGYLGPVATEKVVSLSAGAAGQADQGTDGGPNTKERTTAQNAGGGERWKKGPGYTYQTEDFEGSKAQPRADMRDNAERDGDAEELERVTEQTVVEKVRRTRRREFDEDTGAGTDDAAVFSAGTRVQPSADSSAAGQENVLRTAAGNINTAGGSVSGEGAGSGAAYTAGPDAGSGGGQSAGNGAGTRESVAERTGGGQQRNSGSHENDDGTLALRGTMERASLGTDPMPEVDEQILDQVVLEAVRKRTQRMYEGGGDAHPDDSARDYMSLNGQDEKEVYVESAEKVIEDVRREYQKTVTDLNSTADGMAANAEYRQRAMSAAVSALPQIAAENGINLQNLDQAGWQQIMGQATAAYSANYAGLLASESNLVPNNVQQSQSRFAAFMFAAYDSIQASQAETDYVEKALGKAGISRPA